MKKEAEYARQERDLKRLSSRTEHDIKTNVFDFYFLVKFRTNHYLKDLHLELRLLRSR